MVVSAISFPSGNSKIPLTFSLKSNDNGCYQKQVITIGNIFWENVVVEKNGEIIKSGITKKGDKLVLEVDVCGSTDNYVLY